MTKVLFLTIAAAFACRAGTITNGTLNAHTPSNPSAGSNTWSFQGNTQAGGSFSVNLSEFVGALARPLGNLDCTPGNTFCQWPLAGVYDTTWTSATTTTTSAILWNGTTYGFAPASPFSARFVTTIAGGPLQTTGSCAFGPICQWVFPSGGTASFSIALTISNGNTVLVTETLTGMATIASARSDSSFSGTSSIINWTFSSQADIPEPGTWLLTAVAGTLAACSKLRRTRRGSPNGSR